MKTIPFQYAQLKKAYKKLYPRLDMKNKKTASYFALTFTFLTLSFFGIFAIRPTLTTATSLIKSVADLKKFDEEYGSKIDSLIKAQMEYEKIRDDLPLVDSALPGNANFTKLLKTIERFAAQENVSLTQLQVDGTPISTPSSTSKLNKYGFGLIAYGEYPSLTSFLSHLLNWKRILTVNSLDFAREGSTTSGTLRLTLKGITYYEP